MNTRTLLSLHATRRCTRHPLSAKSLAPHISIPIARTTQARPRRTLPISASLSITHMVRIPTKMSQIWHLRTQTSPCRAIPPRNRNSSILRHSSTSAFQTKCHAAFTLPAQPPHPAPVTAVRLHAHRPLPHTHTRAHLPLPSHPG